MPPSREEPETLAAAPAARESETAAPGEGGRSIELVSSTSRGPSGPAVLRKAREWKEAPRVRALGCYPYFRTLSSAQDTEVVIGGQSVLMMGSNSYLGLTNHPKIKEAAAAAIEKYGTGCAGSRFLNGSLDLHEELEARLAGLLGKEAALLFSTGYQANLGALAALVGKGEVVLADKSDHASIIDGCRLSFGKLVRFPHRDVDALETRLADLDPDIGTLIVVDGVFSMEGDLIQLEQVCDVAERHGAAVMVDDAHAVGVFGERGSGTPEHFGVTDRVHLIIGTFSKSLASLGGFVASDADTIDFLKHHSRTQIFSASLPPANAAAALAALEVMAEEPERIPRLWANTERMKQGLLSEGFDLGRSESPILPVYTRDRITTFRFCTQLQEHGVFVNPVVSPAVLPGHELVRVSLMATHSDAQIDRAVEKFGIVGREMDLVRR